MSRRRNSTHRSKRKREITPSLDWRTMKADERQFLMNYLDQSAQTLRVTGKGASGMTPEEALKIGQRTTEEMNELYERNMRR